MLNLNKLKIEVLETIQNSKEGCAEIEFMSTEEAFDAYLRWNGIIGFTKDIIETLDNIREAEIKGE
jgi:hypothetical protein